MYNGMSINGIDSAMVLKGAPYNLSFLSFFFLSSRCIIFTINLFVGVVISTFNRQKEQIGKEFLLSQSQKHWLEAKSMIFRTKPKVLVKRSQELF